MMGKSRSVSVVVAYLCTVTGLPWTEVLNGIRFCREVADPNPGFKEQIKNYEESGRFKLDKEYLDEMALTLDASEMRSVVKQSAQSYVKEAQERYF